MHVEKGTERRWHNSGIVDEINTRTREERQAASLLLLSDFNNATRSIPLLPDYKLEGRGEKNSLGMKLEDQFPKAKPHNQ